MQDLSRIDEEHDARDGQVEAAGRPDLDADVRGRELAGVASHRLLAARSQGLG